MSGALGAGANLLDPSIALKAGANMPAPINPLAIAGQVQNFQKNQLAIQQAQQTLTSQNALGRIAQSAINPDGTFNAQTFAAGVKADPDATYGAAEAIKTGQGLAGGQYTLNQDSLAQTTNRINSVGAGLAGLLSNPNLSPQDIYQAVGGQALAGKPIGAFVQSVLPNMPTQGQGESQAAYSARLRPWLAGIVGQSAGPAEAIRTLTPNVATVDTGGQTQTFDANPYSNPNAANTTFQKTLTPEGQATPVPGPVGPQGQPTQVSRAAFAQSQGLGGLLPNGTSAFGTGRLGGLPSGLLNPNRPAPAAGGAVPAGGSIPGAGGPSAAPGFNNMLASLNGGTPPAPADGSVPAVPSAASAPAASVPMTVGLGAGQEAGLKAAGDASAKQWADLQSQVGGTAAGGGSAGRIFQLQSALGDLQALGPNGTGAGSDTWNNLKSYFNTIPGISSIIGFDPNTIANYNMANKALQNYAMARAGAHGGTTDSQLATVVSSNASTHISNLAAQQVVQANIGLERMDQAQAQAFQQSGKSPDQFSTFSAQWNASQDPRAYVADQLPPQKVVALVNGMSPAERTKFENTYTTGIRNGWITPPAWAPPAAPTAGAAPSTADIATNPGEAGN